MPTSPRVNADGEAIPNDGHVFYSREKNEFYKERFQSETRTRAAFDAMQTSYRPSRNPILAQPTPREKFYKRTGGGGSRTWRDPAFTQTFRQKQAGAAATLTSREAAAKSDRSVIAAAMEVDVELERLLARRRNLESKVEEIDRVLEFKSGP
ncbi:hypothetical protein TeGR_g3724 [Tetraparma gracilis]|uniref:Uncharacterized protein n=1 Tax=Tetraparma gracilis TaxID=2962635 RepID=A0ABQ6MGD7_9STRA|nr:hypothetical protein TeGR_g3724 [Tetraparma gracilis]